MVYDTPSHGSDHLCLIWKESIQNCRCYRADTACGTDGWTDGQTDGQTNRPSTCLRAFDVDISLLVQRIRSEFIGISGGTGYRPQRNLAICM